MSLQRGTVVAALTLALSMGIPTATATSGDSSDGCTVGPGCDHDMHTNKCPDGVGWFVFPADELTHIEDLGYSGPHACDVRARVRVINADGHNAHYSRWAVSSARTNVILEYDARRWCFSEYQVKRLDGSWYNNFHYSQQYHDSRTRREICTDE